MNEEILSGIEKRIHLKVETDLRKVIEADINALKEKYSGLMGYAAKGHTIAIGEIRPHLLDLKGERIASPEAVGVSGMVITAPSLLFELKEALYEQCIESAKDVALTEFVAKVGSGVEA